MDNLIVHSAMDVSKNEIVVTSNKYDEIKFLLPYEALPQLSCHDFSLWAILPLAMKNGDHIETYAPISKRAYESLKKVADVWHFWLPNFYKKVKITAHNIVQSDKLMIEDRGLMCFSGGLDSTYSTFKLKQEKIKNIDCLSVHGMDYKFKDNSKFEELINKTKEIRNSLFSVSHFVKTNIYAVYNQNKCNPSYTHITHIFSLFACLSIFEGYSRYLIAADDRLDQQFFTHPYGSNSASNKLMENSSGNLITLDDDVTRFEKTLYLVNNNFDLNSLSVCGDAKARPYNCGVCVKCLRTKSMLFSILDYIPDIFVNNELNEDWFEKIDLNDFNNQMYIYDTLNFLESKNKHDNFPGYKNLKVKLNKALISRESSKLRNYSKLELFKAFF
ncbi:hypothetical protein [Acinetobacter sp. NS4_7]